MLAQNMASTELTKLNERIFYSQFDRQGYYNEDVAYLNAGGPSTELLRLLPSITEGATHHCLKRELERDAQLFQYGLENGDFRFRKHLAEFLTKEYDDYVDKDQLYLTGGATSGLWLILSTFFPKGSLVFVEDPSYFCALKVFSDLQLKVVPVKTDEDGILIEDLHTKLDEHLPENHEASSSPLRPFIYVIPTYQNPTTSVLPPERCRKLVDLARKYGALVLCDDVYNLLHYDEAQELPKRLFAYDEKSSPNYVGSVISNGSFSKFLGPGFRMGWLEAPEWVRKRLTEFGVIVSGGGLNTFTSGIMASLLELGSLKAHLEKAKMFYRVNMESTIELLNKELPKECKLKIKAKGGYFLWIELPKHINAEKLKQFVKEKYQVVFMCGQCASPTGSFTNCIRICISFYPNNILLSGVKRLCTAIEDYCSKTEADTNV